MTIRHYKLYRKLMPLPQPEGIWKEILMDFVIGLPSSLHRGIVYDAILVVVDRYSKMVQFVPYNKETTAEELTEIMKSEIIKYFGIFKSCVLDRGSLFISVWWAIFCHWWGIRRKFFTAFHPQIDGVTER